MALVNARFSDGALSSVPSGLQIQTLDSELDSIERALFQARRMRNSKIGPCKLPAEVLAYVFEYLQLNWPPQRKRSESGSEAVFQSGWMAISHVCSMWREVRVYMARS